MTTNDNNQIVRWLVIIVLGVATAGMGAVSLRANYLFGYGFGQTPEVFGWANVAADLWKVSGLIVVTSLWRAKQKRFALSLTPIWLLCLFWGLVGAIGVYAQDRTALIGGREAISANYKDAEREVEEIDAKLHGLRRNPTISCPYFNSNVALNAEGLHHLRYSADVRAMHAWPSFGSRQKGPRSEAPCQRFAAARPRFVFSIVIVRARP